VSPPSRPASDDDSPLETMLPPQPAAMAAATEHKASTEPRGFIEPSAFAGARRSVAPRRHALLSWRPGRIGLGSSRPCPIRTPSPRSASSSAAASRRCAPRACARAPRTRRPARRTPGRIYDDSAGSGSRLSRAHPAESGVRGAWASRRPAVRRPSGSLAGSASRLLKKPTSEAREVGPVWSGCSREDISRFPGRSP
jgi:hypothetical protein